MSIFSVVRFDGLKSREWLIYKYPAEDIVLGSQLIVQEGQVAIFVKNGTVCDVFYPGTYTLQTENLPILNGIVKLPFGGQTPFSAEIYFVNVTTKLEIAWGTIDPIQLIDPKYHVKLRIRAFGQMAVKILDPVRLFKEVVGGMPMSDLVRLDKVKDYFKGILVIKVKSAIADIIINEGVSALEISVKLEQISNGVKSQITPEFERYGFEVVNFYTQSINFPDEDFEKINKILEDKAAFEIMGENRYVTKRSFDVYEGAATNESGVAGAFVAGGLGMGAAMGMHSTMQQNMGNPMQQPAPAAAPETKQCPSCAASLPVASKFCPECGFDMREKRCECGEMIPVGHKFCSECGRKVE